MKKLIDKIEDYQKLKCMHPLTCGQRDKHPDYRGILYGEIENGNVVLKCPNCNYVQHFIPEIIFKDYPIIEGFEWLQEKYTDKEINIMRYGKTRQ